MTYIYNKWLFFHFVIISNNFEPIFYTIQFSYFKLIIFMAKLNLSNCIFVSLLDKMQYALTFLSLSHKSLLSRLVVPTFVVEVTGHLCSRWVFFLLTNFEFLTSYFGRNCFVSFKRYC